MDWHPENMDAFAPTHNKKPFEKYINSEGKEDILWPTHCVANTTGAELHKDINLNLIKGNFYLFKKGLNKEYHPYSGFGAEGLKDFLDKNKIEKLFICGLATDYCVKETVIDSVMNGFETIVIIDGCRSIDPDLSEVYNEFKQANVNIIESWELPLYNSTK